MYSLLVVVLCVCIGQSGFAVEISSKVDLDSGEQCSDSSTKKSSSDSLVIVIENSNTDTQDETTLGSRSSGSRHRAGGNVGFRGPSKPLMTNSNYPHNLPPTQTKMIKNIYIVVNDNASASSSPGVIQCKNDVCEATVFMDKDETRNVIGTIHLSVVTKTENVKVEDIPVIDGIRGSGYGRDDRTPTFVSNNERDSPHPHFLDNNIPRFPVYQQNPWRHFLYRNPSASFRPRTNVPHKDSSNWNYRTPGRSSVDDKIEPPLSRTN